MPSLVGHPGSGRLAAAFAVVIVTALAGSLPAAAFSSAWTTPKRVSAHDSAPLHSMTSNGSVHIATERGSTGIWHVTNAGGSWTECQVSHGDDRYPSIALSGGVVHVAFARRDAGSQGILTASTTNLKGPWSVGFYGRHFGAPDIIHSANNTFLLYGGRGRLFTSIFRGGIRFEEMLSGSGRDVKPQLDGDMVTFARNKGTKGVCFSRPK